jgi:uncharacterized protein YutE (UPF0331/DUF86 family)
LKEWQRAIGEIIISAQGIKRPESYKEIFRTLGENGILPEAFARKIEPAAGFRNVLVHMYAKVDEQALRKSAEWHSRYGTLHRIYCPIFS